MILLFNNDDNNNNNNNKIYRGSPLALAVFSGALQIINDKTTKEVKNKFTYFKNQKLRKEIKIDIYI